MSMAARSWSDAEVHAFLDGQLDAALAARLRSQLAQDPALAERVARQRDLREQLAGAYDRVLEEPIPERLQQALQGKGGVAIPIGRARAPAPGLVAPRALWWGAAAASVLVAALIGWSLPRTPGGPFAPADNGLLAAGSLAAALSQRIAAEGSRDDGVMIALSFRAGDGRYCRTFSLDVGLDGLACRTETGWLVEAIGRSPAAASETEEPYRRASSALSPAVLAAISRWQAGDALTPEEERNIRSGDWR